jgi:hypothetical protein
MDDDGYSNVEQIPPLHKSVFYMQGHYFMSELLPTVTSFRVNL